MPVVYLDNAATTSLDLEVLDAMLPFLKEDYGNPSSIYSLGRTSRLAIEEARKNVASLLDAKPAEIFFTSCGTESSNTVLKCAVEELACTTIITSKIEHHATLNTVLSIEKYRNITVQYLPLDATGCVDYTDLGEMIRSASGRVLVSLMHANNEIGTLLPVKEISAICKKEGAYFHSDMVQSIGHYPIQLNELGVDFVSASAHKFHGPKGSGLLYISSNVQINPLIVGGGQERNMRAGTENVANIIGFSKALELALASLEEDTKKINALKIYCWEQIQKIEIQGEIELNSPLDGLFTVLNVSFPSNEKTEMLQMALDMKGICVSGGSACSSGAAVGSHVINAFRKTPCVPLRISFSKHNSKEDIDALVKGIKEIIS